MRVVIGSDKEGMPLKELVKRHLLENGHEVVDKSEVASADLVDSATAVAHDVLENEGSLGIAFDRTASPNADERLTGTLAEIVLAQAAQPAGEVAP